jgi:hypothetical protein
MTTDQLKIIMNLADKYADAEAREQQGFTNHVGLALAARTELSSCVQTMIDNMVKLEEQLKKYEPVKQKVPALFKPAESEV